MVLFISYSLEPRLKGHNVLNQKDFRDFAKDNFVCVKVAIRYNYKTDSYEPANNSNMKAFDMFGYSYKDIWIYSPKSGRKQRFSGTNFADFKTAFEKFVAAEPSDS